MQIQVETQSMTTVSRISGLDRKGPDQSEFATVEKLTQGFLVLPACVKSKAVAMLLLRSVERLRLRDLFTPASSPRTGAARSAITGSARLAYRLL